MISSFLKRRPDNFNFDQVRACKTCATEFQGRYCSRCGEKVVEPDERSIKTFLMALLNAFTFLDGKFFRSIKLLIATPGKLSRHIADGMRVPYMNMVSLFFVANFFYFFFPLWDAFDSTLHTQMNLLSHSKHATEIVNKRLEKDQLSLEDFTVKYQAQSTNLSKMLLVVLVILFALALFIVNFSRRIYFFDHMLFSFEVITFQILINLVVVPHIFLWIIRIVHPLGLDWNIILSDKVYFLFGSVMFLYFLLCGQINFYGQKWYWGLLRTVILLYAFSWVVTSYRALLFYFTVWTM